MTTAQRLDSLTTELGALDIMLGVHVSNARFAFIYNERDALQAAIREIGVAHKRIAHVVVELMEIQPGAGAATPPAAANDTLPALIYPAPGLALAEAGKSVAGCTGTRGGTCANCGEYSVPLVPSIGGRWDYCRACADLEIAEEAPAAPDDDGDNCQYLYPDPDEQLDELRDRRMDERRAS